jgi:hypothetical protein
LKSNINRWFADGKKEFSKKFDEIYKEIAAIKQERPGVGETALSQNSIGLSQVNAVVGSPELISSRWGGSGFFFI